jgi:hypothetical protein
MDRETRKKRKWMENGWKTPPKTQLNGGKRRTNHILLEKGYDI